MWSRDKKLEHLEACGMWSEAIDYLFENWLKATQDPNTLVRVGSQIFYTLLSYQQIDQPINRFELGKKLTVLRQKGEKSFPHQADFLCVFGYIYEVAPYFYQDFSGTAQQAFAKAQAMYQKALLADPHCAFAPVLNFPHEQAAHPNSPSDFREALSAYLPGNSAVETFFKKALG
jgi:hypothetical protein